MPIITITTSSSTNVNPRRGPDADRRCKQVPFIVDAPEFSGDRPVDGQVPELPKLVVNEDRERGGAHGEHAHDVHESVSRVSVACHGKSPLECWRDGVVAFSRLIV